MAQAYEAPVMKLMLRMKCRDLVSLDLTSQSDPIVVIKLKSSRTANAWTEIGRTEQIENNANPDFHTSVEVDYYFEEQQFLQFSVVDSDNDTHAFGDFIGSAETTLGEIVGAGCGAWHKPLVKEKSTSKRGIIHCDSEEIANCNAEVHMQFRASGLDKKDFFGKSDPFLEIHMQNPNGDFVKVHSTETIMKNLNPTWRPSQMSLTSLCNGDMSRKLLFKCYDWDSDGRNDLIGTSRETTAQEMTGLPTFDLINPKKIPGGKKAKKGYTNSGVLTTSAFTVKAELSFVEHLHRGLQLHFTCAIDFTGSNGDPKLPSSLHFMNPHAPNEYVGALTAVGNVIQDYDSDKLFPALGYGAKLADGSVSHNFSLTGDEANPFCNGIAGVVEAYKATIMRVQLWGPTNFAPIIKKQIEFAQAAHAGAHKGTAYYVMMIVTDGAITDMGATKDAIVAASHLPISIIIVGVGAADFSKMDELDGDDGALCNTRGERATRDLVQFVPFRKYQHSPELLAKEVLKEIPTQVCSYMDAVIAGGAK